MEPLGSEPVRIRLLGTFEASRGGRILRAEGWKRRKAAALLQRLALERRLVKDQAIEFLWPETEAAAGANNLYRVLHALRRELDEALGEGAAEATLAFEDGVLSLHPPVWVDVHAFERLLAAGGRAPARDLEAALALYAGELLPDERYAEWTLAHREALRRMQREASLALAESRRRDGDYGAAIALLVPLLAQDRADEETHRQLMRLYALAGRRHDSLRQYQACIQALAEELDAPPSAETTALYTQILRGDLLPAPPPLPSGPAPAWQPPAPVALEVEPGALLVGRQSELESLRSLTRVARRGRGQTVLIAGESGMGKTRLAFEALRSALSAGMLALMGAAYEQEGRLPYQPFVEAFDHYLAGAGRSPDENPITHFKRLGYGDVQQEQWALFNAAARFLVQISAQAPLVFLIDDLHAADEASLQLFHYLARQTRASPIVLIATFRDEALAAAGMPFANLLNALYREGLGETLHLSALSAEAVAEIVAQVLGGPAAPSLAQAVYEVTAGNPFFAQEISRTLARSDQIEQAEGRWSLRAGAELGVPASLGGLLRQRVMRLGPAVEAALTSAAVIGGEFTFDVLRGVAALSDGEVLDALDRTLAAHLVEETRAGYRFRHPLIRRTLYDSLSRVRRARLHARTAETIEALYARHPQGLAPHIETLAYHYDLSDRRDRALEYLIQAGEKAAAVYAFEIAIRYYERALALMDEIGLEEPALSWTLLESLGWWGNIFADTPRAVGRFEQALALEPARGWRPSGRDRLRLHGGAAAALITAGEMAAAEAHLQVALEEAGQGEDTPELADLLYNLAQLHWHRNEYREALEVARQSLAMAERLQNPAAMARAFEMLSLACHSLGEWQAGIAYEQQRAALAGPGLDVADAFDVHL